MAHDSPEYHKRYQLGESESISRTQVLFAAVLLFARASGKFEQRRVLAVAFAFAAAVFTFAFVRTAMLPFLK
jgi:hypothetical protein